MFIIVEIPVGDKTVVVVKEEGIIVTDFWSKVETGVDVKTYVSDMFN